MLWEVATSKIPYDDVATDKAKFILNGGRPTTTMLTGDKARFVPIMSACWDKSPNRRPSMIKAVQMLQVLPCFEIRTTSAKFPNWTGHPNLNLDSNPHSYPYP